MANKDALLREIPKNYCVVSDIDNPAGRFAHRPGIGGVDPIDDVITWAQYKAGELFEVDGVVLIGWSIGCEAVRSQLAAGVRPVATLALDGTSGNVPPLEAQLSPWRDAATRARVGVELLVLTHTLQTYVEALPLGTRYAATVTVCRAVTGWPLDHAGVINDPAITRDGGLIVASYQSARIDGKAHIAQQTTAMPDLLRRFVVPWMQERAGGKVPSAPPPPSTQRAPIQFIAAKNFTPVPASTPRPIDLVVIHTAETECRAGIARAVANWFAGSNAPKASSHYVVDPNEVIACVREGDVAWAAPGANHQGVQVEVCGRASMTETDWTSHDGQATLERVADLVADICARHGIPVRKLGPDELLAGARGICGHVDASKAWHKSTHYDPGAHFAWARLLDLVAKKVVVGSGGG